MRSSHRKGREGYLRRRKPHVKRGRRDVTRLNKEKGKEQIGSYLQMGAQMNKCLWKIMLLYLAKLQTHIPQLCRPAAGSNMPEPLSCLCLQRTNKEANYQRNTFLTKALHKDHKNIIEESGTMMGRQ